MIKVSVVDQLQKSVCKTNCGFIFSGEKEDGERSSERKKKTQSAQTCEEEEREGGQDKERKMMMMSSVKHGPSPNREAALAQLLA